MAGVPQTKYRSRATYYDGDTLHTSFSRGCPGPTLCPICSCRKQHDTAFWYQSRAEALCAQRLDQELVDGRIYGWRRSKSVLLVDAPRASDRERYRPDFDVWTNPITNADWPDKRIEVKGGRDGIAYSGKLKILQYRDLVRKGLQPPLEVLDAKGNEIDELTKRRSSPTARKVGKYGRSG